MKFEKPDRPAPIGLFRAQGEMLEAGDLMELILQTRLGIGNKPLGSGRVHWNPNSGKTTLRKPNPFASVPVKVKELGCEIPEIGCETSLHRSSLKC
jgi:hypothetical protein